VIGVLVLAGLVVVHRFDAQPVVVRVEIRVTGGSPLRLRAISASSIDEVIRGEGRNVDATRSHATTKWISYAPARGRSNLGCGQLFASCRLTNHRNMSDFVTL
jgi:hypothetical protein